MMVERERLRLTLVVIQTLLADVVDDTDAQTPHVAHPRGAHCRTPWANSGSDGGEAPALPRTLVIGHLSFGERVGTNLEVDHLAGCPLTTLDVPVEVAAVVGPESAALPPRVRVVDAPVQTTREEPERIRDA